MITKEETKRALDCAIRRKKVGNGTGYMDWIRAIRAEVVELKDSYPCQSKHIPYYTETAEELADVVITCMSMAANYGVDLGKAIKAKMKYNEIRED